MHASKIVALLTRLLALKVVMDAIVIVFSSLARGFTVSFGTKVTVVLYLLCAGALWGCALKIGRAVTKGFDSAVEATPLTLTDFYSVAFVCVGLYYAVGSLSPTLTWLHYVATQSSGEAALSPKQKGDFYNLFQCLSEFLIGLFLVLRARRLSSRLLKYDEAA